MASTRSAARAAMRVAARSPAPRVVDPVAGLRNFVRTSPWLAIAIAAHVIVGATLAVVQLANGRSEAASTAYLPPEIRLRQEYAVPVIEEAPALVRHEIPENRPIELSPDNPPVFAVTEEVEPDWTLDRGDPDADPALDSGPPDGPLGSPGSTNIGVGEGGHRGAFVAAYADREFGYGVPGGDGRGPPQYGRPGGPTEFVDRAIFDGLVWLTRHQDESGRWSGATCAQNCPEDRPCQPETALEAGLYSTQADVGLTSLALLAFLGCGLAHDSDLFLVDTVAGRKRVAGRDVIRPGLKWLVDQQRPDGSFSDAGAFFLYNEALAALALSEAYGLSGNQYWKKPAQRAIDFICRAQKPHPTEPGRLWGWRYQPAEGGLFAGQGSDADMSVTGWMVMALKSAELAGLEVPAASIAGALDFTRWSTGTGGLVGYTGPETAGVPIVGEHDEYAYHVGAMSSIGMCVRIFLEQNPSDPFLVEAAEVLAADRPAIGSDPDAPTIDYYYWYYGSLALEQLDGPDAPRRTNRYWGPWNRAMNESILGLQETTKGACSHGGWMRPDRWAYGFGPVYTTAINVLTLEVYYRYENALGQKREPGVGARRLGGADAAPTPERSDRSLEPK